MDAIPSLREQQEKYDAEESNVLNSSAGEEAPNERQERAVALPENFNEWFENHCTYLNNTDAIGANADAIISMLSLEDDTTDEDVVIGLNAEW